MNSLETKYINFNGRKILVGVVKNWREKMKGATIFQEKPANIDGILFIGYNPLMKNVWMKGMKFPLNIYFLDENMNIINAYENAEPCNKPFGIGCKIFKSSRKYSYILELWR